MAWAHIGLPFGSPQCLCRAEEDRAGKANVKDGGQKEVEEEIGKQ